MKKIIPVFFAAFFCDNSIAQTVTITLAAAADNSIYQIPAANSNAIGQNIFSGTNGGGSPRRGLLKFNVSAAIPSGATITAVTLTLNCNLSRAVADNVSLHRLTSNWGEGTSNAGGGSGDGAGVPATTNDATWTNTFFPANNWVNPGGDFAPGMSATQSISGTGFYNWSSAAMIADVQTWLNTPVENFGWILICKETEISTARKFGSRENTIVANRPSLSVTYTTVLPVVLSSFRATAVNSTVTLQWITQQENNNSHFEVLQSTDGVHYNLVGIVQGNGTTAIAQQYQFSLTALEDKLYYKLAQVDFDGKKIYSFVVNVNNAANNKSFQLVSNIITRSLNVKNGSNGSISYAVHNQHGQLVMNGKFVSNSINTERLPAGVYYLTIHTANKTTKHFKFIKTAS